MKCEAFWPSKIKSILQKLFYDKKLNILRNFNGSQIIYLDVWYNFENKILKVFGISDFHFRSTSKSKVSQEFTDGDVRGFLIFWYESVRLKVLTVYPREGKILHDEPSKI